MNQSKIILSENAERFLFGNKFIGVPIIAGLENLLRKRQLETKYKLYNTSVNDVFAIEYRSYITVFIVKGNTIKVLGIFKPQEQKMTLSFDSIDRKTGIIYKERYVDVDDTRIFVRKNYLPKSETKNVYLRLKRAVRDKRTKEIIKKESCLNMRAEKKFWDMVKQESVKRKMYLSTFIKYCLTKELEDSQNNVFLMDEYAINDLLYQVKKIGVNINQIAKKVNQGDLKEQNFANLAEAVNKLEKKVQDFDDGIRVLK